MSNLTYVPAPSIKPVPGGLFSVAEIVDNQDRAAAMGAHYESVPCTFPHAAPGDCWISIGDYTVASTKSVTAPGFSNTILNFPVYAGVQCFAEAESDYDTKAIQLLEAGESVAVERIFYNWLTDNAGTALVTPVASVTSAFGFAEFALAGQLPTLGLIHANRYVTSLAAAEGNLLPGSGPLVTHQGTPIANGGGYQADPTAFVPAPAELGELFVTGAVTIYRSPIQVTRAGDWTHNKEMAIAERNYAIAVNCNFVKRIDFSNGYGFGGYGVNGYGG
jgi:hypothetical protein